MATIIHIAVPEIGMDEWKTKAESCHMRSTHQFGRSWRYLIAKGNIIEGILAEW